MGYRHIDNLYKNQNIMIFKECIAMEKIHGTSAHVSYKVNYIVENSQILEPGVNDEIKFFSGGANHMLFMEFFDRDKLLENFRKLEKGDITVYGEAYGGKLQGMRETYGEKLWFTAFEVRCGDYWLGVESAEYICSQLGIEFVPWERIPCTLDAINEQRDRDSVIAKWRTGKDGMMREGVVLRPIMELTINGGGRIICKHKREEFSERSSKKDTNVSQEELQVLTKAREIAEEWVTPMRLRHVIDKMENVVDMSATPRVMEAMVEDITREGKDEILDSKQARKAIQSKTAVMLKKYFQEKLREENS